MGAGHGLINLQGIAYLALLPDGSITGTLRLCIGPGMAAVSVLYVFVAGHFVFPSRRSDKTSYGSCAEGRCCQLQGIVLGTRSGACSGCRSLTLTADQEVTFLMQRTGQTPCSSGTQCKLMDAHLAPSLCCTLLFTRHDI